MPRQKASHENSNVSDWMKKSLKTAIKQADRTKKDISTLVAKEVRLFLDGIEVDTLLKKALAGQTIEINATIKFSESKKVKSKTEF